MTQIGFLRLQGQLYLSFSHSEANTLRRINHHWFKVSFGCRLVQSGEFALKNTNSNFNYLVLIAAGMLTPEELRKGKKRCGQLKL